MLNINYIRCVGVKVEVKKLMDELEEKVFAKVERDSEEWEEAKKLMGHLDAVHEDMIKSLDEVKEKG